MSVRTGLVRDLAQNWISQVFTEKNDDYGDSYILSGKTIELWFPQGIVLDTPLKHVFMGLLTRMLDKLIRASNLVLRSKAEKVKDEKAYQTLGDLGVYGFMTAEVVKNSESLGEQDGKEANTP